MTRPRKGTFVADVLPEKKPQIEPRADRKVSDKPIIQQVAQRPHNDGVPDPRLIPYELFSRAYRHALIKITQNQYMGYGDPRGMAELRQALKQMLSMERFMNVAEDEICVVRGSQMGIFLPLVHYPIGRVSSSLRNYITHLLLKHSSQMAFKWFLSN